jgi:hypothetical protein
MSIDERIEEPPRICAKCRTPTALHVATTHFGGDNGSPKGSRLSYRCNTCGASFSIDDIYRWLFGAVFLIPAGPIGVQLLRNQIYDGQVLSWMTAVAVLLALMPIVPLWELAKRVRHPVAKA